MTGPDGDVARGWWRVTSVDAPRRLEFTDGFAGDDGEPSGELGETHASIVLEPKDGGTRMTLSSTFASVEQLQQMIAMGMQEGLTSALGQIDAILDEIPA